MSDGREEGRWGKRGDGERGKEGKEEFKGKRNLRERGI